MQRMMVTSRRVSALPWICTSCRIRSAARSHQRRGISENVLQRRIEAEWQWKAWAQEIKAGKRQSMLSKLEERGYINQITGTRNDLDHLLTNRRIGAYVGVDPTASSMHVGHLIPCMALFWMYLHGFHTVTLLGGATAKVGDPSGRLTSREKQARVTQATNTTAMHYQLKKLWLNVEAIGRKHGYQKEANWHRELANNSMWLNKASVMEVLQTMGSGLRIGAMLGRDTVKNRMEKGDGMSFGEFCYPLLQAWDWWHMFHTKGVQLQIGGSDQFGNIVSGLDSIKYVMKTHPDSTSRGDNALKRDIPLADHEKIQNPTFDDPLRQPMGFTVPLLTTSTGEKFGKSAGNAIWLDKEQTSVFDLYGYFVGTPDADVERLLKLLTFLPLERITETMQRHRQDPSQRIAQHLLASEFVELIHGPAEAVGAAQQHQTLFANRGSLRLESLLLSTQAGIHDVVEDLREPATELKMPKPQRTQTNHNNAPSANVILPRSLVYQSFPRLLYSAGMVGSRSEGSRLVDSRGAYVGSKPAEVSTMDSGELTWTPIRQPDKDYPSKFVIEGGEHGDLLILRIGKWKVKIIRIIEDEEFDRRGLDAPGWADYKLQRDEADGYEKQFGAKTFR